MVNIFQLLDTQHIADKYQHMNNTEMNPSRF